MSQALKLPVITCLIVSQDKCMNSHIIQISNELPNLKIIEICETLEKSCDVIKERNPNVIFWDRMTINQESIDCLKKQRIIPQIVLLSKSGETTMDLPDYYVTTEIEQPFESSKFAAALNLVVEIQVEKEALYSKKMAPTVEPKPPQLAAVPDYIFLRTDGRISRFDVDEILYFHGHGEYVMMKTVRGEFKLNMNMKRLAGRLEHPLFLKTHRAFVINISKISHIEENEVFIGSDIILISRAHRTKVKEKLNII